MNVLLIELNPFIPRATPISLGYIAAYLKEKGNSVRIMSLGADSSLSIKWLRQTIDEFQPGLVGFSAYQRNIPFVKAMAKSIRTFDPSIRIAIGGPQATFMPSSALSEMGSIDFICRSEGELAMEAIVTAIEGGKLDEAVPGATHYIGGNEWIDGPSIDGLVDLDAFPSPYLTGLLDPSDMDEAIMLTSRGCPFHCIFCYTPRAFGQRIRFHSIERVIEEMEWLVQKGVYRFWLADPSFSCDLDRTERLLDGILRGALKVEFWLETRADLVTEEILQKMKAAGVYLVAYGLESASEMILMGLGKRISLEKIQRAIKWTQKQGLDIELFSQYGLPHETFDDALETLRFVREMGVKIKGNTNSQQMQLYFGTRVYDRYKEYEIKPLRSSYPGYLSFGAEYETAWMSKEEIQKLRKAWKEASIDGGKRVVS